MKVVFQISGEFEGSMDGENFKDFQEAIDNIRGFGSVTGKYKVISDPQKWIEL
ncbi:MAG: hypothetical protein AABY22_09335 [Nanoarchaeota archaeon]